MMSKNIPFRYILFFKFNYIRNIFSQIHAFTYHFQLHDEPFHLPNEYLMQHKQEILNNNELDHIFSSSFSRNGMYKMHNKYTSTRSIFFLFQHSYTIHIMALSLLLTVFLFAPKKKKGSKGKAIVPRTNSHKYLNEIIVNKE